MRLKRDRKSPPRSAAATPWPYLATVISSRIHTLLGVLSAIASLEFARHILSLDTNTSLWVAVILSLVTYLPFEARRIAGQTRRRVEASSVAEEPISLSGEAGSSRLSTADNVAGAAIDLYLREAEAASKQQAYAPRSSGMAAALELRLQEIRNKTRLNIEERLTTLSSRFSQLSLEVEEAQLQLEIAQRAVLNEQQAVNEAEERRVHSENEHRTIGAYARRRVISRPIYGALLFIGSLSIWVLATLSIVALGLSSIVAEILGIAFGVTFALTVHLLPHGLRTNPRSPVFKASVVLGALITLSTGLLAFSSNASVSMRLNPLIFFLLVLVAVSLLASFFYSEQRPSDFLYAQRTKKKAMNTLRTAMEELGSAQITLRRAEHARFTEVEGSIRQIRVQGLEAGERMRSLVIDFVRIGGIEVSTLDEIDLSVDLPSTLTKFERWLQRESERLDRPS